MAKVVYGVMQKPLVERLVDAACIYWEVDKDFFSRKLQDEESTERRHLLFWLLRNDAGMGFKNIGTKFGYGKATVIEGCGFIDFRIKNYRPISDHVRNIRHIAANLEARIVVMDVKLEHFLSGGAAARENGDGA